MSNYDGKIELPQMYGEEHYLSSDKSDTYLWLAEKNTKQAKQIARLQEQLKEANDCIKGYVETTPKVPNDGCHIPNYNLDNAERYLKKWGVE